MSISVALCTYNGERYLREQLDSIAGQTLPPDELVVCDDCSSDTTMHILEEFREQVSFPVLIHLNEKNLGSTKNFEKAICLCQGDIIALCDQDDIWLPRKLEIIDKAFHCSPEAGYVFSDANLIDENGKLLNRRLWDAYNFRGDIKERFLNRDQFNCFIQPRFATDSKKAIGAKKVSSPMLIVHHYVTGATMAFRKTVAEKAMPFHLGGHWIHDGWIAIIASSIGAWGVAIDDTLVAYRQHSNQQIGIPDTSPVIKESPTKEKRESLLQTYLEFKSNQKYFYDQWETRGTRYIQAFSTLNDKLKELQANHNNLELEKALYYLNNNVKTFETHFLNRKKILTTKGSSRYLLILQEALSGRYNRFSHSWWSIFRDLFLGHANG